MDMVENKLKSINYFGEIKKKLKDSIESRTLEGIRNWINMVR